MACTSNINRVDSHAGEVAHCNPFTMVAAWTRRVGREWVATNGVDRVEAGSADDAAQLAERWTVLGFRPVPTPGHRDVPTVESPAPTSPVVEPSGRPWVRHEAVKSGRTCRRVRRDRNKPMTLYDRPRTRSA